MYKVWKKTGLSISIVIMGLYVMMYLSSVILQFFYNARINTDNIPFFYLSIVLLILLLPVICIDSNKVEHLIIPSNYWLEKVINVLTIGSFLSFVYYIPSSIAAISVGLENIESVRNQIGVSGENPFIQRSLFNTIASVFSTFYMVQISLFFVNIIKENKISFKSLIILLSSMSYVFLMLSFLGRDGFLFWIISFIVLYIFFSKFMEDKLRNKIKRSFLILSVPFIFIFVYITMGRFLLGGEVDILYPFVSYLGQGPINFTYLFNIDFIPSGGSKTFSLFFGNVNNEISSYNSYILDSHGINTGVFRTLVGSFYPDFGTYGTLAFSIIVSVLIFKLKPKRKDTWDFSYMLVYMLYIMIMYQGIFYFRLYDKASNLYILIVFILYIVLKKMPKQMINKNFD